MKVLTGNAVKFTDAFPNYFYVKNTVQAPGGDTPRALWGLAAFLLVATEQTVLAADPSPCARPPWILPPLGYPPGPCDACPRTKTATVSGLTGAGAGLNRAYVLTRTFCAWFASGNDGAGNSLAFNIVPAGNVYGALLLPSWTSPFVSTTGVTAVAQCLPASAFPVRQPGPPNAIATITVG